MQSMFTRAHQQPCIYLLIDSLRKIGRARLVNRNYDRAAQGTTKKRRHPLSRVRSPQQDPVAFADGTLLQFAGKTERCLGHLPVAPAFGAVSAPLDIGALPPTSQKGVKIFDEGAALHA